MNHLMIDLETLGTGPRSAIASIGWCAFSTSEDGAQTFEWGKVNVDLQSCLDAGLTVDGPTLRWWLEQQDDARLALFTPPPRTLPEAFYVLGPLIERADLLWAKPPSFDLVIMKSAIDALGFPMQWDFRAERDLRTLLWLVDGRVPVLQRVGPEHDAGFDARYQAEQVIQALAFLRGLGRNV